MTPTQVRQILGNPIRTEFIADKWVWKYELHQYWKGWVPYYLVFDKRTQRLQSWFTNEEEYYRNQQLWLQAFPPTQKHEVDIKIKK